MRSRIPGAALLALLPVLAIAGMVLGAAAAGSAGADDQAPSAWEDYLSRHPGAADSDALGPLERRVLHAMTPEQAEAFFDGTDATEIVLQGGQTLAGFLADSVGGGPGLVYIPVDQCRLFSTAGQTAPVTGPMAADEIREYVARGAGAAHTDQGGVIDCGIPTEAVAIVTHFRVAAMRVPDARGFLKAWASDTPEPSTHLLDYEPRVKPPDADRFRFNATAIVELCDATLPPLALPCATGEFKVKTALLGGQVRGDVSGYLRPIEVADVPGAGDADTLDGFDSLDFAFVSHTHDGGDINSGLVGEPYIDPSIARDSEVVDLLKAGDGSGSGFDADLLDGLEATAFRPRPQNVILVDVGGGGDFTSIQAALDAIGVDPNYPAASAINRYLIRVGVGVYNEQVTMDPFVDIEGKGKKATIISSPSIAGPQGTLECADDAELRNLTVESTGGAEKAIAIRCAGSAPMLTHVKATATGADGGSTNENIGILNDGVGAMPMLTGVWVDANPSSGLGVVNQNGAMPTIRDSDLGGADSAIENRDTATAKVANTALAGGADVVLPAVQASYMCVRAYDAGTLAGLNAECFPNTPPTATDDSYKTLGNTLLEVDLAVASGSPSVVGEDPAPLLYADVLDNDTDTETPGSLTASAPATSTLGGDVAMNADGSFSYTPPQGVTGVTDDFDYTVTDAGGLMDTGTVQIAISEMIWFVDDVNGNDANDGRSDGPFATLGPLDGAGGAGDPDGAGHTIFVFTDDGATTGGIELEDNQILQGHEVALDFAGFNFAAGAVLVSASTAPSIGDAAGDVVELASGNTVRGLDIAATSGLAITGTGVAGVTIDQVGTGGTGTGNGVLFDGVTGTIAMSDLDINSSTNWGVGIQNSSATFTFDAASSITNPTGVAISVTSGAPNVTYSGTITNNNAQTINVSSTTGGTVLFDGTSINGDSSAGILLSSIGGTVTVDADATTLNNSSGTGIKIQGTTTGTLRFDDVTISSPTDEGIDISGGAGDAFTGTADFNNVDVTTSSTDPVVSIVGLGGMGGIDFDSSSAIASTGGGIQIDNNGAGTITFNGPATLNTAALPAVNATTNSGAAINFFGALDLDTTTGTGFNATGGGTVQATSAGNTVDTMGTAALGNGIGVNIGAGIGGLGVVFNTVNVGSSGKANSGILLSNTGNAGTFAVNGGTIQNTTSRGFHAAGVDGTVNIAASIQNDGGRSVEITGSEGQFTFDGLVDDDAQGINISSNTSGSPTFTFRGGIDVDTSAGNIGFRAFSGGTLNVCADDNCSAGGGTPVVNTIDVGADIALSVSLVDIGADGLTFRSINSNGGANTGITLSSTGTAAGNGGLTVTGNGGVCTTATPTCTGGRIQNKTGANGSTSAGIGIFLNNTKAPSLSLMRLNDFANFAIRGTDVAGFSFTDSVVDAGAAAFNGNSTAFDEGSISFDDLSGTATFLRSVVSRGFEDNIVVTNDSGTLNMSFTNGTIGLNDSNDGILVESQMSAVLNLTVTGTTFQGSDGDHIQCNAIGSSTMDCTIQDNTFQNAHPSALGSGVTISGGSASSSVTVTYDISGTTPSAQTFRDSVGSAITVNPTNGDGSFTGTIQNNKIGVSGVPSSGSSGGGAGIAVGCAGSSSLTHTTTIHNNDIDRIFGTNGVIDLNTQIACTLNATITSNTVDELEGFTLAALYTFSGGANTTDTATICADVRSNSFDGSASFGFDHFIDQLFGSTSFYRFPGYGGGAAPGPSPNALDTFLDGQNTLVQGPPFGVDSSSAVNVSGTGTTCP